MKIHPFHIQFTCFSLQSQDHVQPGLLPLAPSRCNVTYKETSKIASVIDPPVNAGV